MERRYLNDSASVTIEERDNGTAKIVGYAARFHDPDDPGTEYRLSENYVERIMPTAFTESIQSDDVRALFNHDPNIILGRNKSGTLRLSVDSRGLRYEIDAPTTQAGRDVVESIRRGDITGSSFGFVPVSAPITRAANGTDYVRNLERVSLLDVSPVTFPAYESASVGVRSQDDCGEAISALEAEKQKERIAVRLRELELDEQFNS